MTSASANLVLHKPAIAPLTLADGLRRNFRGWMVQEKSDGRHEFLAHGGSVFNAERMASGGLVVNDLVSIAGQDVRRESTRARWAALAALATQFPAGIRLCRVGHGGEFLESILAQGGEGVVAKHWDAAFGVQWFKCKRAETFQCRVTGLDHARGSVHLADAITMQPRGKLPLRGGRFEQVRIGSILKVEAFGAHKSGLLREARLDSDTPESWRVSQ